MALPDRQAAAGERVGGAGGGAEAEVALVLYDGWCNLCDSSVGFILRRDRRSRFRFAALQSAPGIAAGATCGGETRLEDTLVVVYCGRCLTRSAAVLTILALLPFPWPLLTAARVLPRRMRDWAYDVVAQNRTAWFGRPRVCMTSLAEYEDRFLG